MPDSAACVEPCSCKSCRYRSIMARVTSPTLPPRSRVQWEVWADGEDLRHGFDRMDEAVHYAAGLSDEWKAVEIVCVKRTVTSVR